jgi:hypothetical protein
MGVPQSISFFTRMDVVKVKTVLAEVAPGTLYERLLVVDVETVPPLRAMKQRTELFLGLTQHFEH